MTTRLWSLKEMLRAYASEFLRLGRINAALELNLELLQKVSSGNSDPGVNETWSKIDDLAGEVVNAMRRLTDEINLPSVNSQCDRIEKLLASQYIREDMVRALRAMHERVEDSLEERQFFYVKPELVSLYSSSHPFGQLVSDRFPSASFDISEAGKCQALGRSTASVFHLTRITELGLRAIHNCLGIAPPNIATWGEWLKNIREERSKRGNRGWSENDLFQDLYSRLDAIKDAIRNPTIHVQTIYTEEEAKLLYDATKALMEKISSRMDEKGLPLA